MYRILLVEDDAALADAITQVLTAWGHEVQKVRDFRHVTEEFAEWKPQIVLMDLMLPFFNGHHWTQELRRITSVPIVYLSSASDNLNIVMAMNMGGDDFIAKPVDPAVLAAKVNAVYGQYPRLRGCRAGFGQCSPLHPWAEHPLDTQ